MSSPSNRPPRRPNQTSSPYSTIIYIDGPWDNTPRPRRPNIPYMPPRPKDQDGTAAPKDADAKPNDDAEPK